MSALPNVPPDSIEPGPVLTKAFRNAASFLGLTQREMAEILGISEASVSRLGRKRFLEPETKEGELALLFLRAFRALDALLGGDVGAAHSWFHAENSHLGGVPASLVQRVDGLVRVVQYLDAMRGRN